MILQSSTVSGKQCRSLYLLWFLPVHREPTKGGSTHTHQHNSAKMLWLTQGEIQLKQMVSKLQSMFSSKLLHKATGKVSDTAACCIKSAGPTVGSEVSQCHVNHHSFILDYLAPRERAWVDFAAWGKMKDLSSFWSSLCILDRFRGAGCTALIKCHLKHH